MQCLRSSLGASCSTSVPSGQQQQLRSVRAGLNPLPRRVHGRGSRLACSASRDRKNPKNETVNWDGAWRAFTKAAKLTDPESLVDRKGPTPNPWGGSNDEIRKSERRVLNIWSNPWFAAAGGASVLITLFVFIVVIGPPPSDGRCSLPWCG